jgi:broad specificity phosphatase PhoE
MEGKERDESISIKKGESKTGDVINIRLQYKSPIQLILIRYGQSCSQSGAKVSCDDPLSDLGFTQAEALRNEHSLILSNVKHVCVSPLSRALETAMIIFRDRPDVTLHIFTDLREFNMNQKRSTALYTRHVGHTRRELEKRFSSLLFTRALSLTGAP